jgi:hypothetical protein
LTHRPTRAAARSVGWARSKPLSISAFYGPKKRISSLRKVLKSRVVYEVRELGTIVRCLGCENALVRFAHHRGRYLVDLRETRYLTTR